MAEKKKGATLKVQPGKLKLSGTYTPPPEKSAEPPTPPTKEE